MSKFSAKENARARAVAAPRISLFVARIRSLILMNALRNVAQLKLRANMNVPVTKSLSPQFYIPTTESESFDDLPP